MTANTQPKDNSQRVKKVLNDLVSRHSNVISVLIVSDDGLNVASAIPAENDDDLALITSDLLDTAREFSQRLEQGRLTRILLEGQQRTTILMQAGKRTVLVVSVIANEKLGLVTHAMRQAADQVAEIFS